MVLCYPSSYYRGISFPHHGSPTAIAALDTPLPNLSNGWTFWSPSADILPDFCLAGFLCLINLPYARFAYWDAGIGYLGNSWMLCPVVVHIVFFAGWVMCSCSVDFADGGLIV